MKPKLVMFGGTGGLGRSIAPLLQPEFDILAVGSNVRVDFRYDPEDFFRKTGYIPYLVYMAVANYDAVIHKLNYEETTEQIEVNIRGFLNVLKYALPLMRENKFGRIIYMSSILSEKPIPGTGIYSATKAFNDNLIKTCALENAKYSITCNSLQLGYFRGGLTDKVPENILKTVLNKIPLQRLGEPEDLYNAVKYVFNAPYLTGSHIALNGGLNLV